MADLRERIKGLVEEMESEALRLRDVRNYSGSVIGPWARKLAAILAESEPGCEVCAERARVAGESARFLSDVEEGKRLLVASLPLGHPFVAPSELHVSAGMCLSPDGCHWYTAGSALCGQPRSAHEPKP